MNGYSKFFTWLAGIAAVAALPFQILAFVSASVDHAPGYTWLKPAWFVGLLLTALGVLLMAIFFRRRPIPWIVLACGLIGAGLALAAAIALVQIFPAGLGSDNQTVGLTFGKLCYRHLPTVLSGLLLIPAALCQASENKQARTRRDFGGTPHYDLSGAPIFKDGSTLGLDTYGGKTDTPKQKRSVRKAAEKAALVEQADKKEQ